MIKRLSGDQLNEAKQIFSYHFNDITQRAAKAAREVGREPSEITLLAATKTVDPERINFAMGHGVPLMGENRVQEFLEKADALAIGPERIHFIGHLQTNKVKYLIGRVSCIQSVDNLKLAGEIARLSSKAGITTDVLAEINIGSEKSKSGVDPENAEELVREMAKLDGISVKGLMTIPPICDKNDEISYFFARMQKLFIDIRGKRIDNISMEILSMGMSGDFEEAIRHGTTMIRIGTALFGKRTY